MRLKMPLYSIPFQLSALALLWAVSFVGCDQSTPVDEQFLEEVVSFESERVTLLLPEELVEHVQWNAILDEWQAQTLGQVEVVTYAEIAELLSEFESAPPQANTILFFPRTDFAEVGVRNLFQPIPEVLWGPEDFNWKDLFESLRESASEWNGEPAVLPVREPTLLLYYRPDLLEAAGKQPPRTWDEYRELLDSLDQWAPGLAAVEPWHPEFRSMIYLAHALPYVKTGGNFSVFFEYREGQPLIDSPGFVRGLTECREMLPSLDSNSLSLTPDACLREIREGRAALAIGSAFAGPEPIEPASSEVTSANEESSEIEPLPIAVLPLPGAATVFDSGRSAWRESENGVNHVSLTGWEGLSVGVLKTKPSQENLAAWNLLHSLMITYPQHCFAPGYLTSTRLSSSRQIWSPPFPRLDERSHSEAVEKSLRHAEVVPALMISHRERFLEELSAVVDKVVVEQSEDPEASLKGLAMTWKALMEEFGSEETLSSYAQGLGTLAKRAKLDSRR